MPITAVSLVLLAFTVAAPSSLADGQKSGTTVGPPNEAARQASAQACWPQLKQLQRLRRLASEALRECRLHEYDKHCKDAEDSRKRIQQPGSPCASIKEVDLKALTALECNVVKVPDACAD